MFDQVKISVNRISGQKCHASRSVFVSFFMLLALLLLLFGITKSQAQTADSANLSFLLTPTVTPSTSGNAGLISCSSVPLLVAGQTVTFDVIVDLATPQDSVQTVVKFNSAVLQYVSVARGADFNETTIETNVNNELWLLYGRDNSMAGGSAVTGLVNFATITFNVLSATDTQLEFADGSPTGAVAYLVGTSSPLLANGCLATTSITPDPVTPDPVTPTPVTPTPVTPTPYIGIADSYESDNDCNQASTIGTDGMVQQRNFHTQLDEDWIRFDGVAGSSYQINGETNVDSSADLSLELYNICDDPFQLEQEYSFAPGVRTSFLAETTGSYYIKLSNNTSLVSGTDYSYQLSVRKLEENPDVGAAVIIGGRYRLRDPLQDNIYNVVNRVYKMYFDQNYDPNQLFYLAPDLSLDPLEDGIPAVDIVVSNENVHQAIISATQFVDENKALTIYLMAHGNKENLYLDGTNETLSSADLNRWLTEVETAKPGVKINVIIDSCFSGSFIDLAETISKPGRLIITSSQANRRAWATEKGAAFSDHFLPALAQGLSVYEAFALASDRIRRQIPWIDANGNGIPNEVADGVESSKRGFSFVGTFGDSWEPWIQSMDMIATDSGSAELRAKVVNDDENDSIVQVTAYLYPASDATSAENSEMIDISTIPSITLSSADGINYTAPITFDRMGEYELVIYAEDSSGLISEPSIVRYLTPPLAVTTQKIGMSIIWASWQLVLTLIMLGLLTFAFWLKRI